MRAIESAINELSSPNRTESRVIWGSRDMDRERIVEFFGAREGLLNCMGVDFQIAFPPAGDSGAVELTAELPPLSPREMRQEPELLSYIVAAPSGLASLSLMVDDRDGDDVEGELWITGIRAALPLDAVNGRTLSDALRDICVARGLILDRLKEEGFLTRGG